MEPWSGDVGIPIPALPQAMRSWANKQLSCKPLAPHPSVGWQSLSYEPQGLALRELSDKVTHITHRLPTPPRWHAAQGSSLEREAEEGRVGGMVDWASPGEKEAGGGEGRPIWEPEQSHGDSTHRR